MSRVLIVCGCFQVQKRDPQQRSEKQRGSQRRRRRRRRGQRETVRSEASVQGGRGAVQNGPSQGPGHEHGPEGVRSQGCQPGCSRTLQARHPKGTSAGTFEFRPLQDVVSSLRTTSKDNSHRIIRERAALKRFRKLQKKSVFILKSESDRSKFNQG
jgi:hypothetical protein